MAETLAGSEEGFPSDTRWIINDAIAVGRPVCEGASKELVTGAFSLSLPPCEPVWPPPEVGRAGAAVNGWAQ
jgi:hypothetical protein